MQVLIISSLGTTTHTPSISTAPGVTDVGPTSAPSPSVSGGTSVIPPKLSSTETTKSQTTQPQGK